MTGAAARYRELIAEAAAAHDLLYTVCNLVSLGHALAHHGDPTGGRAAADAGLEAAAELGGPLQGQCMRRRPLRP